MHQIVHKKELIQSLGSFYFPLPSTCSVPNTPGSEDAEVDKHLPEFCKLTI